MDGEDTGRPARWRQDEVGRVEDVDRAAEPLDGRPLRAAPGGPKQHGPAPAGRGPTPRQAPPGQPAGPSQLKAVATRSRVRPRRAARRSADARARAAVACRPVRSSVPAAAWRRPRRASQRPRSSGRSEPRRTHSLSDGPSRPGPRHRPSCAQCAGQAPPHHVAADADPQSRVEHRGWRHGSTQQPLDGEGSGRHDETTRAPTAGPDRGVRDQHEQAVALVVEREDGRGRSPSSRRARCRTSALGA